MIQQSDGIELRSLSEQVFEHVRGMILTRKYEPGQRIPEEGIADELGVSRTPIREALRKLNEYGLVVIKPRTGATVAEVTEEDAKHVTVVRAELEGLAARLLTSRMNDEILEEIRELSDVCRRELDAGNTAATFVADSRFHLAIASHCGNPVLLDCLERLDARIQLLRATYCGTTGEAERAMDEHMAIISALASGDGAFASRLLTEHSTHWHLSEGRLS